MNATIAIEDQAGGERLVRLSGRLDATSVARLWRDAHAAIASAHNVRVEATGVEYCDGAGLALLFDLQRAARGSFHLIGLREEFGALLAQFEPDKLGAAGRARGERLGFVARAGRVLHDRVVEARTQVTFLGEAMVALLAALRAPHRIRWKDALAIAERAGADALPIVALIAFLMGVIIAFQSAIPMRQFGAEVYVADLVGLSMLRELGPLMTAILIAGRSGAAFAAELGTMKVNDEISALSTMGLDPVRFLVVTRLLAGLIVTPLLTIFADIVGLIGGAITMLAFSIPTRTYFTHVGGFAGVDDFLSGVAKSFVFGLLIAGIGCLKGLQTRSGAAAVGDAATRAVVSSIVMIVVVDGIFALIYYSLDM